MKKQQQPFHYVANLKEAGAKIAVEFHPSINLTKIYFVKGGKKHVLSMFNNDPRSSYLYTIDQKTDKMSTYSLIFDEDFGVQPRDEIGDEGFENEED